MKGIKAMKTPKARLSRKVLRLCNITRSLSKPYSGVYLEFRSCIDNEVSFFRPCFKVLAPNLFPTTF